jgi:hypothetical protein
MTPQLPVHSRKSHALPNRPYREYAVGNAFRDRFACVSRISTPS